MKTLLIGLGNPILGDDGVGWAVAAEVEKQMAASSGPGQTPPRVEVDCLSLGGLSLMERLIGYQRAILVDALETGRGPAGSVHVFPLEALPDPSAGHSASAHDTTLLNAIQLGRQLGADLPEQVTVVAVEAGNVYEFTTRLSPDVAAAVPRAAGIVLGLLQNTDET
jgi:hydrogenase maturation protease